MVKDRKQVQSNDYKDKKLAANGEKKIKYNEEKFPWREGYEMFIANLTYILLFTLALSVYFYKASLRGCFDSQAECLKNLNEGEIRELLALLSKCAFILAGTVTLVIYGFAKTSLLAVIGVIYGFLCLYYDVGSNLDYHGSYNRIVLLVFFLLWLLGINIMLLIVKGLKTHKIVTICLVVFAALTVMLFYRLRVKTSCKDWAKGLKGVEIDDSNIPCRINYPKECWIDVLEGFFDYSGWMGEECKTIRNGDRSLYDKYFYEKDPNYTPATLLGFPRTEHYTYRDSIHFVLDYKVLREMIDMNDPNVSEEVKNRTEIMVDYSGEESKVIIRVQRDEKLLKTRLPLYQRLGKKLIAKNVMIIYIDALSRRHFMRKMKKTQQWIDKFYKTDHPKYTSYQFMKYHSLGYFTQINTIPAFHGKWWLEAGGNCYIKYWKEKGGITAQSNGVCGRELYDLDNDQYIHLNWENYDHEQVSLSCDPNFNQADNPYTPFLGPYSVRRRCLHGKDIHDYQLEYGFKFWEAYKDLPKVLRIDFIDAHEGSMEVVKYLDDKLEKFLNDLETNDMLEDTVLLFMADHGNNMPGFISMMQSKDYKIEKYFPMMFLVIPEKLRKVYGDALEHNEQSIVTPWDIHNTLLHLGGAPMNAYNPHGMSFLKKVPNERFSCERLLIRDDFCQCT